MPASWLARETMVVEHRVEVERGAERLADLAERRGAGRTERVQLRRARLELAEQPGVLDRDGRLVGEGLHQADLAVGERLDLVPVDR